MHLGKLASVSEEVTGPEDTTHHSLILFGRARLLQIARILQIFNSRSSCLSIRGKFGTQGYLGPNNLESTRLIIDSRNNLIQLSNQEVN